MRWLALLVLAAAWLAVVLPRLRHGSRRDDAIDSFHIALERLSRLEGATRGNSRAPAATPAHVRVLGRDTSRPAGGVRCAARTSDHAPVAPTPLISPAPPVVPPAIPAVARSSQPTAVPSEAERPPLRRRRSWRWRRYAPVTAGALLLAAGVLLARSDDPSRQRPASERTSLTSPAAERPPAPTSAAQSAPDVPAVLTANRFDGTTARYTLGGPGTLTLTATAPCWVEVRDRADAPAQWQATLQPGETRTVAVTTTLWVRLGNPSGIHLGLGGVTIAFPGGVAPHSPINIDLTIDPGEEEPWPVPAPSPVEEPTSAPSVEVARS